MFYWNQIKINKYIFFIFAIQSNEVECDFEYEQSSNWQLDF